MHYLVLISQEMSKISTHPYGIPCLVLVLLFSLVFIRQTLSKQSRLPPGPTPLPIIGNVHQIPGKAPWRKFDCWARKYGPIVSFKLGSRTVIVLGSRDVIRDLFEKRGNTYSRRPRLIAMGEHLMQGELPALMPYGPRWISIHRLVNSVFNARTSKASQRIPELASRYFMSEMLNGVEDDIGEHLHTYTGTAFSALVYGAPLGSFTQKDNREIRALYSQTLKAICIENVILDVFPILERIPFLVNASKRKGRRFYEALAEWTERKATEALARPWWNIARVIHDTRPEDMSWASFRMLLSEMELAGLAATPATLGLFVTMAALHSDEMRLVQCEIDRVIGASRLPTSDDLENLPRMHAFMNERLRIQAVASLGVPRSVLHEEEYKGYRIPTDAILIANQWAVNMDDSVYENPTSFRPSRWIESPQLPLPSLFGVGKKICPGRHISKHTLSMAMVSMVWGFAFHPMEGVKADPDTARSLLYQPPTSRIRFTCRSLGRALIIQNEWKGTEQNLSEVLNEIGRAISP